MDGIFIGMGGGKPQAIDLKRANRHGLIAGATGTGKTVTLQTMVEGFSRAGVPSFVADVKGDLSGLGLAGSALGKTHAAFAARAAELGMTDWSYEAAPVQFWDLFGTQGHPVRATVSEMGPLLLARMMGLNETQEGVLTIAFHVADKEGLLLLDLDDLQAMLAECAARADELTTTYGNVSKQSVGAIQRALLQLRTQGGEHFFGEPALELADLIRTDEAGRGVVNILAADQLMASPKLYATFLLWLLSELFEQLPEIGDPDKPRLVFFFDEAHLLFDGAAPALVDTIERVVRLIRSKGVGVYFNHPEPDRRARQDRRAAGQPCPARAARLHTARPGGGALGRRDVPRQSRRRCGQRDHRAEGRRGAGVAAPARRLALAGRAHDDRPAAQPGRARHARRAQDIGRNRRGRREI
ncbi:DNA helicase HerA-like ATPase [Sphingomonas sp. SORGH_AS 950]|nr:DNA helicase HerA-like ATPase [Sphingomonas sp. SORGH_AS_0950]